MAAKKTNRENTPAELRPLTAKEQMLIKEFVVDLNGKQAAIRAGYSERSASTIAAETLAKPNVRAALRREMDALSERVHVTQAWVMNELLRTYRRASEAEEILDREGCPVGLKWDGPVATKALDLIGRHIGMFKPEEKESKLVAVQINNYLQHASDKDKIRAVLDRVPEALQIIEASNEKAPQETRREVEAQISAQETEDHEDET